MMLASFQLSIVDKLNVRENFGQEYYFYFQKFSLLCLHAFSWSGKSQPLKLNLPRGAPIGIWGRQPEHLSLAINF